MVADPHFAFVVESAAPRLETIRSPPVLQITEARAQNSKNALARRALAARARANP
jgi:hypothetical protein